MDVVISDKEYASPRPPHLAFDEFAMDLLIHIQSFMDPADIMALRRSSKIMAAATRHRTVWISALRRVCALHEVPMCTYPVENMSLAEFEHAATSPARFLAQIFKNRATDDLIPAFSTRLFKPRLPRFSPGPAPLGEVSLIRLIPGGRYLVTSSDANRICVWDLGYSPAAIVDPYPLASTVAAGLPRELLIQPTKDHRGLRLLTYYILGAIIEIMVFEIYPATNKPTFTCIAKRRVDTPEFKAVAFTPERFTWHHDFLVTVWDFVEDTCAALHIYQPLLNMTVSPTTIIGQHEDGISVIDIPPLHPTGTPAAEVVVEPVTPLVMFSHVHAAFEHFADVYAPQGTWHSSPVAPVVLDVFGVLFDGTAAYARCPIKPVSGGDPDLPRALPVLSGISRVPPETYDSAEFGPLYFARTHLVRTWLTGNSIMVNTAKIPARRQIEFESNTDLLCELPDGGTNWVYDLDPVSGRLVALTTPEELRILDYMLPNA
ncbi:hypothetical protein DFH07DRAFT_839507 [Mycena maculata]|uniref:F-box domain-containing protein n=1 Tax=Mycena maculata TaxID=230809 RepID=A0AAD7N024_9AGAR|nr:hypothetical protein DFH07DRAFT_839507 [Mycena maculata]